MEISDLGWLWRPLRAIAARQCEIKLKLLLITNRKSHISFRMTWKSFILHDIEGQYCNRNCIGCSVTSEQGVFIVRNICKTCVRYFLCSLISRLHDEAGSTSWLNELPLISWTSQLDVCSMFARCLLDVWSTFARCLLDVCLMFASCKLCFMHASYLLDLCLIV